MFKVSCSHTDPRWTLTDIEFADTSLGEWGDCRVSRAAGHAGHWYAIAPAFGCGRDYDTPERAITVLLQQSGATHIRVENMNR